MMTKIIHVWQEYLNLASNWSLVVEYLTIDSEIEGLNPAPIQPWKNMAETKSVIKVLTIG